LPQITREHRRLEESEKEKLAWKTWGPYLSERQWGTVREDYSGNGDAWNYFTHDMARSRAYRWGEDGMAGISDDKQLLCFALALWNGNEQKLGIGRYLAVPTSSRRTRTGMTAFCFTNTSTATTGRGLEPAIRRDGLESWRS
jgi:hypothetical protein